MNARDRADHEALRSRVRRLETRMTLLESDQDDAWAYGAVALVGLVVLVVFTLVVWTIVRALLS